MGNKKRTQKVALQASPAQNKVKDVEATMKHDAVVENPEIDMFDDMLETFEREALKSLPSNLREQYGIIKSIYGTHQVVLDTYRKTVWGHALLAFEVKLQDYDDPQVFVKLDVQYPPEYPKLAAEVRVQDIQPEALLQQVRQAIADEAKQLGDDQMVPAMLAKVTDLLQTAAESAAINSKLDSLEVERENRAKAAQELHAVTQKLVMAKKKEEASAQDKKLMEDLQVQKKRLQMTTAQGVAASSNPGMFDVFRDGSFRFDQEITISDQATGDQITFRSVYGETIMLQRDHKTVRIVSPIQGNQCTGQPLLLKQIYLPRTLERTLDLPQLMGQVEKMLHEVQQQTHSSVTRLHAYKIDESDDEADTTAWKLSILTELSPGGPLNSVLEVSGPFDLVRIRKYARQLLDALEFFDRKGHLHPAIHAGNILFFGSSRRGYGAKLADGYGTLLRNLVDQGRGASHTEHASGANWAAPELSSGPDSRTSKTCIWELGVVLLQMALGNGFAEIFTSPEDALGRVEFEDQFTDFVSKMCATTGRRRPDAFTLQSHEFFKSSGKSLLKARGRFESTMTPVGPSREVFEKSRWETEWEPVDKVGKGGFGQVFKARNRMDGQFYAVKRLVGQSQVEIDEIWKEVRLLAQLNHSGIVRYYNAWKEDETVEVDTPTQSSLTQAETSDSRMGGGQFSTNDPFALPSTGHDFMNPSMRSFRGPDHESSDDDDDDDLFGYQSPPSVSDGDLSDIGSNNDQAIEDDGDPFGLPTVQDLDDEPNPFGGDNDGNGENISSSVSKPRIPSRPQPFKPNPRKSISLFKPRQLSMSRKSTLYIQMELCETGTLNHLIKAGLPNQIDDSWRIFRSILDGLEHIHSFGVVHRDLKPANIFIDSRKIPKIGDFGLATPGQAQIGGRPISTKAAGTQSRGIGTLYYTAPELESAGSGQYSSKADMFSLGIIFFEMCFPFNTEIERYEHLKELNKRQHRLPSRFNDENYEVQGRIISRLIDHDQDLRPSAAELLQSPEIPEPLEDEKQQRFLDRLFMTNPDQYQQLVHRMLQKTATKAEMLSYYDKRDDEPDQPDELLLMSLSQQIKDIFLRHGAIEGSRQSIFPVEHLYSNAVTMLDPAGFAVQLPYDLTVPFARSIAITRPRYPKAFCFGTVYRKRVPEVIGLKPLGVPEVDFDFVSFSAKDLSLKDAQVISVLDNILTGIPVLSRRTWVIIINHGDLLESVLKYCLVPEAQFPLVKRTLSQLHVAKTTWKQVQQQLRASPLGLPSSVISALAEFHFTCNYQELHDRVLELFRRAKENHWAVRAQRTLARLQSIQNYLTLLRVRTKVTFCPLSNNSEQLYQGSLMFQCIEAKSQKVLSVGGRYDHLIRSYQVPGQDNSTRSVGFRLNMLDLVHYVNNDIRKEANKGIKSKDTTELVTNSRTDVVVTSFDETTLQTTCLEIMRNLLDNCISAEVTDSFTNFEELEAAYGGSLNFWLVIVRTGGTVQRAIKVRSPTKDETDITQSDLVGFLKEELGEQHGTSEVKEPRLKRSESSHGADRENVVVLTPQHKSKKVNRAAIVDTARSAARELAETLTANYKILAIDTDDETLQRMRNTRMSDGESWRGLRHGVALTEREYVNDLYDQLLEWANSGQQGAFICNYKTKSCIVYDFGKT